MTASLLSILKPIQAEYQASSEWQDITNKAYPSPEVKKKEKKKDRGSRHPGAADPKSSVQAKPDGHVEGNMKDQDQVNLASGAEAAIAQLYVKE